MSEADKTWPQMLSRNSDGQGALSEGDNGGRTVLFHSCNKLVRLTQVVVVMVQAARESKLESASASQVSTSVTFAIVSLAKVNCTARANVRRYYPGRGYGEM